ncbi:MAG: tagaturonate epimerase family protein [candidate division KSB1 bacterium]|nr:tagaturonate epimerase family protein [candidate division KSB1 bacterium]
MKIEKYSMGIGDRFGREGSAQLTAMLRAREMGISVVPVWNKSHREHQIVGTHPDQVRQEADTAVNDMNWNDSYYVDADHIGLDTVDEFIKASDFFTLDVADQIGESAGEDEIRAFVDQHSNLIGELTLPVLGTRLKITKDALERAAQTFLYAVKQAGRIYRHIQEKSRDSFVIEVSMDETASAQTPAELFLILAAIADEGIPVQTLAPRFSGRFNKGVDYVGDVQQFKTEFEQDLAVIRLAVVAFDLPDNLKLSVHSGSDKFAIYTPIREALQRFNAGLHLKTAGTTWLEELIGLAEAGGDGLKLAIEVYTQAYQRYDELAKPYAKVIDIHFDKLPSPGQVSEWDSETFATALRHNQQHANYQPDVRQLLHVAYKIAAEMGDQYLDALQTYKTVISRHVTENLLKRHIRAVFPAE